MSRKDVIRKKIAVLQVVKEKKDVLFGSFNANITNQVKQQAWKEVLVKAQSLELASADKTWTYARDKLFGLWKCRTLQKRDNANRTGSAGGKEQVLHEVDHAILDILGKESPAVCGLGIIESSGNGVTVTGSTSSSSNGEPPHQPHETFVSSGVSMQIMNKPSRKRQASAGDFNSLKLELFRHEIYLSKLKALKLEKELGLQPSEFTSTLLDAPADSMEVENDLMNESEIFDIDYNN